MGEKQYYGIWSNDYKQIEKGEASFGYLDFDKKKSTLTIIGNLTYDSINKLQGFIGNQTSQIETIYGLVDSHKKITLYQAIQSGFRISYGGLNEEKYVTKYVFFDGWIDDFSSIEDGEIILSIKDIEKRFLEGLNIKTYKEESKIEISKGETRILLGDVNNFKIYFRHYMSSRINGENYSYISQKNNYIRKPNITIDEHSELFIETQQSYEINELLELIYKLMRFFSFIMNKNINYSDIKIINSNIQLGEKPILLYGEENISNINGADMFLCIYNEIKDNINIIINLRFKNYETLTHIIDTYFFIYYSKNILKETAYLYYIQSLEGIYHSIFNPPYGEEEYNILKKEFKKIKSKLSKEYPIIKNSQLSFNDVSLLEKLRKIGDYIDYNWGDVDDDYYKQTLIEYRNILSHGIIGERRKNINQGLQYNLIRKMQFVIEMFILKNLDIPNNVYKEIFNYKLSTIN